MKISGLLVATALLALGCNRATDGPIVGTETGNALTVGGVGDTSAGVRFSAAHVDLDGVSVRAADCLTWVPVSAAVAVDLLGAPARWPAAEPICGVRLPISRVTAQGKRGADVVALDIAGPDIELTLPMAIPIATVELDLAPWLEGLLPAKGSVQIEAGDDAASAVRRNVGANTRVREHGSENGRSNGAGRGNDQSRGVDDLDTSDDGDAGPGDDHGDDGEDGDEPGEDGDEPGEDDDQGGNGADPPGPPDDGRRPEDRQDR